MNNKELLDIISPYIKSCKKRDKILILDNLLICTDEHNTILQKVNMNINTGVMAGCTLNNISEVVNGRSKKIDEYLEFNDSIYYELMNIKNMYDIYENISWDFYGEDMQDIESFNELLFLKSKTGMNKYIVDQRFYLPMFYGIIPMNKTDKLDLYIKSEQDTYIVKYIVHKKKIKSTIEIYMRLLNV